MGKLISPYMEMHKEMYQEMLENHKWKPMVKVTDYEMKLSKAHNDFLDALKDLKEDEIPLALDSFKLLIINLALEFDIVI
jgi:hypothetical protein